jgi:phospholipid-translocating ATPase
MTASTDHKIQEPEVVDDEGGEGRTIYFNMPLPADAKDEEGNPLITYPRNKVRTAKYSALSFVPKNLWFQFHNIANIYFLFIIILSVCLAVEEEINVRS